ncbi:hypothetical protein BKA70DRAFT_823569 [Coprinopsis sp. MPI-PUGE-AT-0042]|nr:hypothetical protein BKA70DRAFT_823569 [Coprinopsis sp. MPI-PUGE-AT-0042]
MPPLEFFLMIHIEGGRMLGSGLKKQHSSKALEMEVEDDLGELVALTKREELEEMYGMPFICIPSFISCLHSIPTFANAIHSFLFNIFSSMSPTIVTSPRTIMTTTTTKRAPRIILFFLPTLATLLLSVLHSPHTPRILPWIRIHTYVVVSLMVNLGVFFAGLGGWGGRLLCLRVDTRGIGVWLEGCKASEGHRTWFWVVVYE